MRANFSTASNTSSMSGALDIVLIVDPVGETEAPDDVDEGEGVSPRRAAAAETAAAEEGASRIGLKVVRTAAAATRLGERAEKAACAEHIVSSVSAFWRTTSMLKAGERRRRRTR